MVVLRATQKVLKLLPAPSGEPATSSTALGDWYVNRIVVDRRPLLLLLSSRSRLSIVTGAKDVKTLPRRLCALVEARLQRLGVDAAIVAQEVEASSVVAVARTADRSLTGQMVDFAKIISCYLPERQWGDADLLRAEDAFAETPCLASRPPNETIFPAQTAFRLLQERWGRRTLH